MKVSYDISLVLSSLPEFTQLFERDGHAPMKSSGGWFVPCPFHTEKTPSCQINNDWQKFHCYGCGKSGDPFDYWQEAHGLTFPQALEELAHIAGVGPACELSAPLRAAPKAKPAPAPIVPLPWHALDKWHRATAALLDDPAEIQRIATWRGIEPSAVAFAAGRGLIGSYSYWGVQREAFLVEMPGLVGLVPVSVHIRLAPGSKGNEASAKASWRYDPAGCGSWPWLVGDPATAAHIFVIEGQWDALALISMMGWHHAFPAHVAVVGLRGSTSGAKLLQHTLNPEARIFAIADADGAGARWFDEKGLLDSLTARLSRPTHLHALWPCTPGADLNDLVKRGEITRETLMSIIIPLLPSRHTQPAKGPTFLNWCKKHSKDASAHGDCARLVLADPGRLKNRQPLTAWTRHWVKTAVPDADILNLQAAYQSYRANPAT